MCLSLRCKERKETKMRHINDDILVHLKLFTLNNDGSREWKKTKLRFDAHFQSIASSLCLTLLLKVHIFIPLPVCVFNQWKNPISNSRWYSKGQNSCSIVNSNFFFLFPLKNHFCEISALFVDNNPHDERPNMNEWAEILYGCTIGQIAKSLISMRRANMYTHNACIRERNYFKSRKNPQKFFKQTKETKQKPRNKINYTHTHTYSFM